MVYEKKNSVLIRMATGVVILIFCFSSLSPGQHNDRMTIDRHTTRARLELSMQSGHLHQEPHTADVLEQPREAPCHGHGEAAAIHLGRSPLACMRYGCTVGDALSHDAMRVALLMHAAGHGSHRLLRSPPLYSRTS